MRRLQRTTTHRQEAPTATTITRSPVPAPWLAAMTRAHQRGLVAIRRHKYLYTVPSASRSDVRYYIEINPLDGKIGPCSCEAAERYGVTYPCAHRGAVALAELAVRGIQITPELAA